MKIRSQRRLLRGIVSCLPLLLGCTEFTTPIVTSLNNSTPANPFYAVDMLHYKQKPDVSDLGMLPGSGTGSFWSLGIPSDSLDVVQIRKEMTKWRDFQGAFYIDVEVWPMCYAPDSTIDRSIAKFTKIVDIAREVAPNLLIGIYSQMPVFGYWPIVGGDSVRYHGWQSCNARYTDLASKVDFIFPALYTYYDDQASWDKYALATLEAAHQYGKPVYPFLWPEYHQSDGQLVVDVPSKMWRHELELVRQHADGVILWNGWNRPWKENAPWWQETRSFLQALKADRSVR